MKLTVVPLTFPVSNRFVAKWHRHHAPLPGGFAWYCIGAVADRKVVGVAICGRPTNRNNDDGQTVEVIRLATDGAFNACSVLLGAAARAARAIGARRCITYTLTSEGGSSLRGAGWLCESANTGRSWWTNNNTRTAAVDRPHMAEAKARWSVTFRDAIEVDAEPLPLEARGEGDGT